MPKYVGDRIATPNFSPSPTGIQPAGAAVARERNESRAYRALRPRQAAAVVARNAAEHALCFGIDGVILRADQRPLAEVAVNGRMKFRLVLAQAAAGFPWLP